MAKWRDVECPTCGKETPHRVRMRCYFNKRFKTSGIKYIMYFCSVCGKRRYKR